MMTMVLSVVSRQTLRHSDVKLTTKFQRFTQVCRLLRS